MSDDESSSTTGTKSVGRSIFLTYLLVGIVFPTLVIASMQLWKVLMMLLATFHMPRIVIQVVAGMGLVASLHGSFLVCRKIWRGQTKG